MSKFKEELQQLNDGILPESMNFSLPKPEEDEPLVMYKTLTPEFYIEVFDPELIKMYPTMMGMVMEEYEKNKHRTPLQDMMQIEENKSPFKIEQELP